MQTLDQELLAINSNIPVRREMKEIRHERYSLRNFISGIRLMQIGIDLSPLTFTMTGIGVYVQQLIEAASLSCPEIHWHFPIISELPLSSFFRWRIAQNLKPGTVDRVTIWPEWGFRHNSRIQERLNSPQRLTSGRFDLFHVTNSQSQFDIFEVPYVITVHDLAWMRVPRHELPKPKVHGLDQLQNLIHNAAHVICDSECTRTDVLEFCNRRPEDVSTVLLAPRPGFFPKPANKPSSTGTQKGNARPFFLAVSTIEPRKNFVRLVNAFADVHRRLPDYKLLIAGAKRSAWPDVRDAIRKHNLADHVEVLGRISDDRVRELLWDATALVYPSLYEGFGLPALEAMACGTPVVCSAAGSLGEVVGDAAIIVDPLSVESIADGMAQIVSMGDGRDAMIRRSIEHAARFSWKSTAAQTLAVYRNVLQR